MKQSFFRSIADLRFAIGILLVIACLSIIGTVIEQDQSIETYKLNYPVTSPVLGFLSWDIIIKLGFDHVYKTWWFISFIVIFGASLLTCTFLQQVPSFKIARRCQFFRTTQQFRRLKFSKNISHLGLNQLLFNIKNKQYSIFQQKNIVYCYKGLIGRIAPLVVHFSMILILLGSILSALGGFKAQEIVPKTETFHIQNILTGGQFTTIPNISSRINDFWIIYNKQKIINQFYSDISILNNEGIEIHQATISVNLPEQYQGITYYQTDWNLIGLRFQDKNQISIQYPLTNISNSNLKTWFSWISTDYDLTNGFTLLINSLHGYCSIYDKFGQFIGNLELNENNKINPSLLLTDIISSTGLQIKTDPGISVIYSGFGFLIISVITSYITYSQIWVVRVKDQNEYYIGGNTTRASFDFEIEFFKIVK